MRVLFTFVSHFESGLFAGHQNAARLVPICEKSRLTQMYEKYPGLALPSTVLRASIAPG